MDRNNNNLKRKAEENLTNTNKMEEPTPHEEQMIVTNEENEHSTPKIPKKVLAVNPKCTGYSSPIPIKRSHFQELYIAIPPQAVNSSEFPLSINDRHYQAQCDAMNPVIFLQIHQEYEKMLQQVPGNRVFTMERMRDLIPFPCFFNVTMRILQASRMYHKE